MLSSGLGPYFRSQSVQTGLAIGLVWYLSYGVSSGDFLAPLLCATSLFVAFALPHYAKLSNYIEEVVAFRTALVTAGRLARFCAQLAFNLGAFWLLSLDQGVALENIGGVLGAAFMTTLASFGAQAIAQNLARNGRGDFVTNVTYALSINIIFASLATWGIAWLSYMYMGLASGIGASVFYIGLASDVRGYIAKQRGVGLLFGTFNPFHRTHLELVRRLISERAVEKVYIHPTVIPRLHKDALSSGKLQKSHNGGYDIYETTPLADPMVNYLPFGNKILPPQTRLEIIKAAILEAELEGSLPTGIVEVVCYENIYDKLGFGGVLEQISKEHPDCRLHLAHGSDLGGMWIRSIADEKRTIWPLAVVRRDCISATAIRRGARGMATPDVEKILDQLAQGRGAFAIGRRRYLYKSGVLTSAS